MASEGARLFKAGKEEEACETWKQAAATELSSAMLLASVKWHGSKLVEPDVPVALELFRRAGRTGKSGAPAAYILGSAYMSGEKVTKDRGRAARWLATAANHGHVEAQFKLALLMMTCKSSEDGKKGGEESAAKSSTDGECGDGIQNDEDNPPNLIDLVDAGGPSTCATEDIETQMLCRINTHVSSRERGTYFERGTGWLQSTPTTIAK